MLLLSGPKREVLTGKRNAGPLEGTFNEILNRYDAF